MRRRIMSALVISACCLMSHSQTIEGFVNGLLEQYPKARLLDIYKSCFQDYMGAEHLINDTASVKEYLYQELSTTDTEDLMPWQYESCGIYGNFVRVSLRSVKEGIITVNQLADAFITSANSEERPTVTDWSAQWHTIMTVIDQMGLKLPHFEEDKQFINNVLAQGKYAISHSPDYREAYAPHYRIVRRDIFEQELLPLLE